MKCLCGCGQEVPSPGGKWIREHYWKRGPVGPYIKERFRIDPDTGCHIWLLKKSKGYGYEVVNGKLVQAYKSAWIRKNGPVPEGLQLDHLCRRRDCVNPEHLELVTNAENTRRGSKTHLTWDDIHKIREMAANKVPHREIAKAFMLSIYGAQGIIFNKRWKE